MTLPAATGARTFSEMMNSYSAALLAAYDWATGPIFPFEATSGDWSGYILHTSNTLSYNLTRTSGTILIKVNGATVKTINSGGLQSGTVDLTAQGLTVGTVYTLETTGGAAGVWWLGETKTITYTTPPTFTDGVILTAANLNTLRTSILECESALDWPLPPCPICRIHEDIHGSNDRRIVYRFSFKHVHDTLRYRYSHHARGGYNVCTKIFLNSSQIYKRSEKTSGPVLTGTIDISSLSLTKGTVYYGYVTVEIGGTTDTESVQNNFFRLTQESSTACTPPPIWTQGGTNISAANLTKYGTIIDSIHPGAASPTLPLYYAQPGVRSVDSKEFYIQHRRRWLRYLPYAGKTVTIKYGPNLESKVDLPGSSAVNMSFDLGQIPGLVVGQWYTIDDVYYSQEWSSSQP